MGVDDLISEAWLIADYESGKRGTPIDWHSPEDQELILNTLRKNYVWKHERARRRTVSADQERIDCEGNAYSLFDRLPANELSDPLVLMERREEMECEAAQRKKEDDTLESYSQSVAYLVVLWKFNNIRIRTAEFLAIHRHTLRKRISCAAENLRYQPSLFDRIEKLAETFIPKQGTPYRHGTKLESRHAFGQWQWDF